METKITLRECVRLSKLGDDRPFLEMSECEMALRQLFAASLWIHRHTPRGGGFAFVDLMQRKVCRPAKTTGDQALAILAEHCCTMADGDQQNETNRKLWVEAKKALKQAEVEKINLNLAALSLANESGGLPVSDESAVSQIDEILDDLEYISMYIFFALIDYDSDFADTVDLEMWRQQVAYLYEAKDGDYPGRALELGGQFVGVGRIQEGLNMMRQLEAFFRLYPDWQVNDRDREAKIIRLIQQKAKAQR